jgi:hypothetical protein
MKKLIFIFLLFAGLTYGQNTLQVFKNGDLADTYILIGSGTSTIERTYARLVDSVLYVPYKIRGDSLYSYTGDEVVIEDIGFSGGTIDVPGRIITYAGIEGGDTLYIDGYLELAILDTTGADSADVLTFNGTEWEATAGGGGSSLTEEQVEDYVGGMLGGTETNISVTYQDATGDIDFVVDDMNQDTTYLRNDIDANETAIGLNTTHRTSNGTDHTYIDQDVTTTGTPQVLRLGIGEAADATDELTVGGTTRLKGGLYLGSGGEYGLWSWSGSTLILRGQSGYGLQLGSNGVSNRLEIDTGGDVTVANDLIVTGDITSGGYKINTHTIVGDTTLTASMMYGGKFYIEANATVTLPAVASGMSASFKAMGAYTAHIDPNASDKLFLDDTALDDGDKASSGGTSGELIVIEYWSADGWDANSDGWSDGG